MNRKEFLKNCACGLCTCAAAGLIAPESASGAETKAPENWRLPFVKERYAKPLCILSSRGLCSCAAIGLVPDANKDLKKR